jgi:hypothetical protein
MECNTMNRILILGATALSAAMTGSALAIDDHVGPWIVPEMIEDDGGLMVRPRALENATADCPEGTPPTATTVTILLDVDVYGSANPRTIVKPDGVLHGGTVVCLVGSEPDREFRGGSWYHLQGDNVPNGDGWVFSGPNYQSLSPL